MKEKTNIILINSFLDNTSIALFNKGDINIKTKYGSKNHCPVDFVKGWKQLRICPPHNCCSTKNKTPRQKGYYPPKLTIYIKVDYFLSFQFQSKIASYQ